MVNTNLVNDDNYGSNLGPRNSSSTSKATAATVGGLAEPTAVSGRINKASDSTFSPIDATVITKKNPLGDLSSYTYQLTLYMISPRGYDAFIESGRTKIDVLNDVAGEFLAAQNNPGGAFIIAQSGGVNNNTSDRAPGFNLDYYIDNVVINEVYPNTDATETGVTEIEFEVIEPYGFSFLSNLILANYIVNPHVGLTGQTGRSIIGSNTPDLKSFFILGIRFYGYDAEGNPVTSVPNTDVNAATAEGSVASPVSEYFYDIALTELKFTIDGGKTVYKCKGAKMSSQMAYETKRGRFFSATSIIATTVNEAVDQLFAQLNKEQELRVSSTPPQQRYANVYKVEWGPNTEMIRNAALKSQADLNKIKWPGSTATTTQEVTTATEINSKPQPTGEVIQFSNDIPILQMISDIIKRSQYLEDALTLIHKGQTEDEVLSKSSASTKTFSWFSCTPTISNAQWDNIINDWTFTITYTINTYAVPIMPSVHTKLQDIYYPGPMKRYNYWFSGENTEVLRYEQKHDTTFFTATTNPASVNAVLTSAGLNDGVPSNSSAAKSVGPLPNASRQGRLNYGMDTQNEVLTNLYDPLAVVSATVEILGDPDYLSKKQGEEVNRVSPRPSAGDVFNQYYGDSYGTPNPNLSRVYVEIDFKEPKDYDPNTGLLKINDLIRMFPYPKELDHVSGVIYMLRDTKSKFSGGAYTTVLNLALQDFGIDDEGVDQNNQTGDDRPSEGGAAPSGSGPADITTGSSGSTITTTGTRPEQPFSPSKPISLPGFSGARTIDIGSWIRRLF